MRIYFYNAKNIYGENVGVLTNGGKIEKVLKNDEHFNGKLYSSTKNKLETSLGDVYSIIDKKVDLKGYLIMPGVIDVHTHMREPGLTHKEDLETGTRAAAFGGVTTIYDMPNTIPTTVTLDELNKKKEIANNKSIINVGFHFGASNKNNIEEIKKGIEKKEIYTVKVFMNVTTGEMLIEDEHLLNEILKISPLVLVHAEEEMIDKAIEMNKNTGNGLYICHIPSKGEMKKVIKAKLDKDLNNESHPIYAEVTPHHLFLNETIRESSEINKKLLRMKPELRSEEDNEFLWYAVNKGYVDTIATDHAPHLLDEKMKKITFGMPAIETSLSLMLDAYNKGKISISKIQELMCENPAKIMKLSTKGKIEKGYDADIIVVDLNKKWVVGENDEYVTKCNWSPYKGWELKGKNILTVVNGKIVYADENYFN